MITHLQIEEYTGWKTRSEQVLDHVNAAAPLAHTWSPDVRHIQNVIRICASQHHTRNASALLPIVRSLVLRLVMVEAYASTTANDLLHAAVASLKDSGRFTHGGKDVIAWSAIQEQFESLVAEREGEADGFMCRFAKQQATDPPRPVSLWRIRQLILHIPQLQIFRAGMPQAYHIDIRAHDRSDLAELLEKEKPRMVAIMDGKLQSHDHFQKMSSTLPLVNIVRFLQDIRGMYHVVKRHIDEGRGEDLRTLFPSKASTPYIGLLDNSMQLLLRMPVDTFMRHCTVQTNKDNTAQLLPKAFHKTLLPAVSHAAFLVTEARFDSMSRGTAKYDMPVKPAYPYSAIQYARPCNRNECGKWMFMDVCLIPYWRTRARKNADVMQFDAYMHCLVLVDLYSGYTVVEPFAHAGAINKDLIADAFSRGPYDAIRKVHAWRIVHGHVHTKQTVPDNHDETPRRVFRRDMRDIRNRLRTLALDDRIPRHFPSRAGKSTEAAELVKIPPAYLQQLGACACPHWTPHPAPKATHLKQAYRHTRAQAARGISARDEINALARVITSHWGEEDIIDGLRGAVQDNYAGIFQEGITAEKIVSIVNNVSGSKHRGSAVIDMLGGDPLRGMIRPYVQNSKVWSNEAGRFFDKILTDWLSQTNKDGSATELREVVRDDEQFWPGTLIFMDNQMTSELVECIRERCLECCGVLFGQMNKQECNPLSTSVVESKIKQLKVNMYTFFHSKILYDPSSSTPFSDRTVPHPSECVWDNTDLQKVVATLNNTPSTSKGRSPVELWCQENFHTKLLPTAKVSQHMYREIGPQLIGKDVGVLSTSHIGNKKIREYTTRVRVLDITHSGVILKPLPCDKCPGHKCVHTVPVFVTDNDETISAHTYPIWMLQSYERPSATSYTLQKASRARD